MTRLFLYASEVRDAVKRLDGITLPQRTLAHWLARGIVSASVRWTDGAARSGTAARGSGRNACRFTSDDFALVRLVAQLRYRLHLSMAETRDVVDRLGPKLRHILREKTDAVLVVDFLSRRVLLRYPGADFDVRAGQFMLDLRPLAEGNDAVAEQARRVG